MESPVAGSRVLYVKGAPEIVMSRCTLDEARKREYEEALLAYQNKAMRTLGLAYKVIPADAPTDCAEASPQEGSPSWASSLSATRYVPMSPMPSGSANRPG